MALSPSARPRPRPAPESDGHHRRLAPLALRRDSRTQDLRRLPRHRPRHLLSVLGPLASRSHTPDPPVPLNQPRSNTSRQTGSSDPFVARSRPSSKYPVPVAHTPAPSPCTLSFPPAARLSIDASRRGPWDHKESDETGAERMGRLGAERKRTAGLDGRADRRTRGGERNKVEGKG